MTFKAWFRLWRRMLLKAFAPRLRRRRRWERRKTRSSKRLSRRKKERTRRRSTHTMDQLHAISVVMNSMLIVLGVLLLPLGLFHWGHVSLKIRRRARRIYQSTAATSHETQKERAQTLPKAPQNDSKPHNNNETVKRYKSAENISVSVKAETKKEATAPQYHASEGFDVVYRSAEQIKFKESSKETDELSPISTPKCEKDQYIRKRMIIAGSSFCDKEVLDKLEVGTYVDIVAEPSNHYDKDAIMLTYQGDKVGYVSKADAPPFVACLRIKRRLYGVITAIKDDTFPKKYEFEAWFDNSK